ncbi:MAG: class I SAM-dependent RNA methyltransferase [Gemmatimonadaceae bacterium]
MPNPRTGTSNEPFELFAATAPGLESIAAGELKSLGVKGRQEPGGVAFEGNLNGVYLANLWLRTASRVLLRLGRFHASTFYELERRAKKLPWSNFLPNAGSVEVRVTCRKSKLYHSDAVAERVIAAIRDVSPSADLAIGTEADGEGGDESSHSKQLFVVRIVDDQCEISADTSGDLLHRRGYRKEVAKAPLRETLAAAMLLASGWKRNDPLLDPMCGSGTIPIEAALLGRRIAPGLSRNFQFMSWKSFDRRLWDETVTRAKEAVVDRPMVIKGADRDAGAIEAATRNAERAGVAADIQLADQSVSASLSALDEPERGEAWVLTNPPYGVRLDENSDLRNLYAAMGSALTQAPGWRIGVLTPDAGPARQLGVPLRSRFATQNGGIPVSFLVSEKSTQGDRQPKSKAAQEVVSEG